MSKRNAFNSAWDKQFPFSGPVQRQNVGKGSVYVFGNSSILDVDDEKTDKAMEMSTLHKRLPNGSRKVYRDVEEDEDKYTYVERELCEGDSLQSLSLHYGCPVAELKRINGLYTDQDFFARRTLRIPVFKNGLLTEKDEQARRAPRPGTIPLLAKSAQTSSGYALVNGLEDFEVGFEDAVTTPSPVTRNDVRPLLKRLDQDIAAARQKINKQALAETEEDAEAAALARIAPDPSPLVNAGEEFASTAEKEAEKSDVCGTTWRNLAVIGCIIFVAIPICYFLYYVLS